MSKADAENIQMLLWMLLAYSSGSSPARTLAIVLSIIHGIAAIIATFKEMNS